MTKPKRYIFSKKAKAACDLIDALQSLGVVAGVGYPSSNRDKVLIVVPRKGDLSKIPMEWEGFRVKIDPSSGVK